MALVPTPSATDLDTFSHGETETFTVPQRVQAIDQASVLLWMATGRDTYTGDDPVDKIMKWAVLDMAWSLLVKTENKTAINSPFSSERIGSYSYSKAVRQIQGGQSTGIEWFDAVVTLLLGEEPGAGAVWSTTEHVFEQPYKPARLIGGILHDPSDGTDTWPSVGSSDPIWVDGGTP